MTQSFNGNDHYPQQLLFTEPFLPIPTQSTKELNDRPTIFAPLVQNDK